MQKGDIEKMTHRIIQITIRLMSGEKIVISEEAERFSVSSKTIKRDLKKIGAHMIIEDGYFPYKKGESRKKFFYKA